MEDKVCIIGAGSSGIAACKTLHQHQIPFDCFEKGSQIGGNWRYNNDNGMSSAYRSLHINTSRDVMAYSDFPMPKHYPQYPSHFQIIQYFEDYVKHFGFGDKITFNTSVEKVEKDAQGRYQVWLSNGEQRSYKALMVCNGHHWHARYPQFEGNFEGLTLHAHDYKTPDIFEGHKNVVVVGIGNSAVDIACEAARNSTGATFISTRSGAHILPKYILGKPFDTLNKYSVDWLPMPLKRSLLSFFLWVARGKQEDYGIPKPTRKLLSEHPTISQDLPSLVGHGEIKIKPNIKRLEGREILFEDGTKEVVDVLVYATGYQIVFPFFAKDFINIKDNHVALYRNVVHTTHENLYFIGLIQPLGAIMPLAEVQAQWIAKVLQGKVKLPSPEKMQAEIQRYAEKVAKVYKKSPRHTIQVDFYPYKKMIEREMNKYSIA